MYTLLLIHHEPYELINLDEVPAPCSYVFSWIHGLKGDLTRDTFDGSFAMPS